MHPGRAAYPLRGVRDIPYTSAAPPARAGCASTSTPTAASRWCCPTRAPERAAAAAVASCARGSSGGCARRAQTLARVAERAGTVPYLGTPLELVAAGRAHARAPRRRAAAGARRRRRGRRSSASTAAPPARRSRARLDRATALAGTPYSGLSIRAQRTRWASCSAKRADELQLAAAAGARARARLRRLARGLPPGDPRPLAALLGARGAPLAALARGPRVAAPQRRDAVL